MTDTWWEAQMWWAPERRGRVKIRGSWHCIGGSPGLRMTKVQAQRIVKERRKRQPHEKFRLVRIAVTRREYVVG